MVNHKKFISKIQKWGVPPSECYGSCKTHPSLRFDVTFVTTFLQPIIVTRDESIDTDTFSMGKDPSKCLNAIFALGGVLQVCLLNLNAHFISLSQSHDTNGLFDAIVEFNDCLGWSSDWEKICAKKCSII